VASTGLPQGFYDRFPPPKSKIIDASDIDNLQVASHQYFEIDLVITHEVDPSGLVAKYLSRHFVEQPDLIQSGIRMIPFRAVPAP